MTEYSIKDLKEIGLKYYNAHEFTEAAKYFKIAAEKGDADAQYSLGVLYKNGLGVAQNYNEAVKYYYLASEQGHADAQYYLGFLYRVGSAVPLRAL